MSRRRLLSFTSSPLPSESRLIDESFLSVESADIVKELTGFDDKIAKNLVRYYGVMTLDRSPDGYAVDGNRTILLVKVSGVVKGFVHDPTASGSLILPRSAERPLKQLERLLQQAPAAVGFSEHVHTVRLHSGVYQMLLRQIVEDIVSGKQTTDHIDKILDQYVKGNPVLPTAFKLLNIVDPGWTRVGDTLHRDDVFTSKLSWQLIAQRWAVMHRGRVTLVLCNSSDESANADYFARVPQPFWRYLLRLYFVKLCSPAMYEFVKMVGTPEYPAADQVENQIKREFARFERKRKASFEALGYAKEVSLASAPPCIHRALRDRMDNWVRFNLAVIINEVVKERRMAVEPLLESMIAALSPQNRSRREALRTRVTSEIKKEYLSPDPIACKNRGPKFPGIKCVWSGPEGCAHRRGAQKLNMQTVTIAKYWLHTDDSRRVDSVDEASRSSAPSDWEVDSVF